MQKADLRALQLDNVFCCANLSSQTGFLYRCRNDIRRQRYIRRTHFESLRIRQGLQRFEVRAAYVTLTTNIVAAAIQEAGLRAQIAATENIIQLQRTQISLLQRRFNARHAKAGTGVGGLQE